METEIQASSRWQTFLSKLEEQVWYQQIKAKWEELDPQSRTYLSAAVGGVLVLFVFGVLIMTYLNVRSLRQEYVEKNQLLQMVQSANQEIRRLRVENGGRRGGAVGDGNWDQYFKNTAGQTGITAESVTVAHQTDPAAGDSKVKESIYSIELQKVNIRQVVRYAFQLESGASPIKLRNLQIDTRGESTGWLNAKLRVSAFQSQ